MALILRYVDLRIMGFDSVYGSTGSRRPAATAALGAYEMCRKKKRKRKEKRKEKKKRKRKEGKEGKEKGNKIRK